MAALRHLGIHLPPDSGFAFHGIQFVNRTNCARAEFADAPGFSVRRTKLHQMLVEQAVEAGVEFRWGARVNRIDDAQVTTSQESFSHRWLVGADGQNSQVRKWAGLEPRMKSSKRFGFCTHFRVKPWANVAQVHWARGCQIFITPMAGEEVGVAVISRDPSLRLHNALPRFPGLAKRLRGALQITKESGDITMLRILPSVARGRTALVGDASGTVDAVTGHGLSLSFQQAIALAEAMKKNDLEIYRQAHKTISTVPILMTRLMLLMGHSDWIQRRTLRLFQNSPSRFARMLAIHSHAEPLSSVGLAELAGFGWNFLRA
jgi:flavin-dependent dehydrogenase